MITALIIMVVLLFLSNFLAYGELKKTRETITNRYWAYRTELSNFKTELEARKQQTEALKHRIGKLAEAYRNIRKRVTILETSRTSTENK